MKQEAALIGVSVTDPNVLPEEARGVAQRDTIPETMKSEYVVNVYQARCDFNLNANHTVSTSTFKKF